MTKKPIVLNVLSKESYEDCRINDSENAPLDNLASYVNAFDKEQLIVVYCASYSCPASRNAWKLLNELGFKNLYAYEGGIAEWRELGFPTEGACRAPYLSETHERPEKSGDMREVNAKELRRMMTE